MEERTYRLVRVDADSARRLVRLADEHHGIDEVYVRGIADAVRATHETPPEFVPDESGYFETTTGDIDGAVAVLASLTRFVARADRPVLSWREDGQVYLRAAPDGELLNAVRAEGHEAEETTGAHEGVLAEDEGNRKAEEERDA